jgi:hypothetical protein
MEQIISLGAGVQSSTMALMATHGEITPLPSCAIFADTGDEPLAVYEWLEYLTTKLTFPVYTVKRDRKLSEEIKRIRISKKSGNRYMRLMIPFFVVDDKTGKTGMMPRRCTSDFKIEPINRFIRHYIRELKQERLSKEILVQQWIGISTDEAHRMKDNTANNIENRWPLIEVDMTRSDCLLWMNQHGYPQPPRSACVYCPYHNDKEWLRLKTEAPEDFARAVEFEREIQDISLSDETLNGTPYLHNSGKLLSDVEFKIDKEEINNFGNECEGMCGV